MIDVNRAFEAFKEKFDKMSNKEKKKYLKMVGFSFDSEIDTAIEPGAIRNMASRSVYFVRGPKLKVGEVIKVGKVSKAGEEIKVDKVSKAGKVCSSAKKAVKR